MKFVFAGLVSALLVVGNAAAASLDTAAAEAMMKKDKGDKDAPAKLVKKVKEGGAGVWGQVPMPPNVTTPDADVKALVDWILALKK